MCIGLYRDADNAVRVSELASEDTRRRGLRSRARPRRRGVSVITSYPDPRQTLSDLIAHLDRERAKFWQRNLDLDLVMISPPCERGVIAGGYGRDLPSWVKVVATADDSILTAINAAARDLSMGDALLLVEAPFAEESGGSPVLEMYSHLSASPSHGIVAPVLHWAGEAFDPGLRFVHNENHLRCGFMRAGTDVPARGTADPIDATASSCLMIRWDAFVDVGGLDEKLTRELARVSLCLAADRVGYRTHRLNAGLLHAPDASSPGAKWLDVADTPRFARRWSSYLECRFQ